jgi:hypothetical protein
VAWNSLQNIFHCDWLVSKREVAVVAVFEVAVLTDCSWTVKVTLFDF